MTDPVRLMDDFMKYGKKYLPIEQFDSPEDAKRWILEMDKIASRVNGTDRRITDFVAGIAADSRRTSQIVSGALKVSDRGAVFNTLQGKAVRTELDRGVRARRIDEAKTSKRLLTLRRENFKRWVKNPGRFDIEGIDTETHELIKGRIRDKTEKWRRQGLKVTNDQDVHVFVVRQDKRRRLYAMNVVNGQRVNKKVYTRFGTLRSLRR